MNIDRNIPVFSHEKTLMPRDASNISDAQELIKPLVGKPISNETLGITGYLSNRTIRKMGSEKATKKSISPELHAKAVANADILFKNAVFDVTHKDYRKRQFVKQIHRLGALMFDEKTNEYVPVMLTVKEFTDNTENHIYSIEAIALNNKMNSAGQSTAIIQTEPFSPNEITHVPIAEFTKIMQALIDSAKGNQPLPNI